MRNDELLPCPFCGSHAQTDFIDEVSYIIECYGCQARTGCMDDAQEAIDAWNRRAAILEPTPDARDLYAALRAMYWSDGKLAVVAARDLRLGVQTYSGAMLDAAIAQHAGIGRTPAQPDGQP
jgi:endodeoxyribonuclease RalR